MRLRISSLGYSRSYASWVRLPRKIPIIGLHLLERVISLEYSSAERYAVTGSPCGQSLNESLMPNALREPNVRLAPLIVESSHEWQIRQSGAMAQRAIRVRYS